MHTATAPAPNRNVSPTVIYHHEVADYKTTNPTTTSMKGSKNQPKALDDKGIILNLLTILTNNLNETANPFNPTKA